MDEGTMTEAVQRPLGALYSSVKRKTIWDRLGFGMRFDPDLHDWRGREIEGFADGTLYTRTMCALDWKDRLRLLVSGVLEVQVFSKTDCPVARSASRSRIAVQPPSHWPARP